GWMGGVVGTASTPSSTPRSRSWRRSRLAMSKRWRSRDVATSIEISISLLGLQVLRQGGHELVTLRERRAGLLRSFTDEDLHPRKGASSFGVGGTTQLIRGVARDLGDGIHAQDRRTEALDRIGRA